jgi:hypothetical protein
MLQWLKANHLLLWKINGNMSPVNYAATRGFTEVLIWLRSEDPPSHGTRGHAILLLPQVS